MKDERCGAPRDGFMSGICRDFRTGISYDRNISRLHEFELGLVINRSKGPVRPLRNGKFQIHDKPIRWTIAGCNHKLTSNLRR